MKTKLIVIVLAAFGFFSLARAQTLITNVTANPLWTDTGLAVTNGEWININAAGFWSWPSATDPDGILDPVVNDVWLINYTHGSLIAFIGSDPYAGSQWEGGVFQTNKYLEIGTARQFMSTTNGELWLGINDDAFVGGTGDNGGSNYVTITTGFTCDDNFSNMTLSVAQVSSNFFSFYISNGIPNTVCAIYDSADLTHWTLLDSLTLDSHGSSTSATDNDPPSGSTGLTNGAFMNVTAVPYRFYKVSNGPFWSDAIGFEQITVGAGVATNLFGVGTNTPGTNGLIADQLIAPNNTLNGLFKPMIDGSSLPNGSQIFKWNGGGYNYYTYSSGSWSPNGNATLLPGEGAFLYVPTTTTITFAGLVLQGSLTNYEILTYTNLVTSSMIPQAGGLQSVLKYNPLQGDDLLLWSSSGFYSSTYLGTNGTGYTYPDDWYDGVNITNEPTIVVGQSFFIQEGAGTNEFWVRKFPGCCDQ